MSDGTNVPWVLCVSLRVTKLHVPSVWPLLLSLYQMTQFLIWKTFGEENVHLCKVPIHLSLHSLLCNPLLVLTHQQQTTFENIVGKGVIARRSNFSFSHNVFKPNQIIVSPFVHIFDIIFLFGAKFEKPKIGTSGKGLAYRF